MAVMSELWMIIAIIVLAIVLIVLIVYLWRRYHIERQRNRRPPKEPMPEDFLRGNEQAEKEEFLGSVHTDAEEVIYANVSSLSAEKIYENLPEKVSNHPNLCQSTDRNPLLSPNQHEVSVIKSYSAGESVNTVHMHSNALGATSQQNVQDPIAHNAQYNLKAQNASLSSDDTVPNITSSHVVSSNSKLGVETIYSPVVKGSKGMSSNLQNKPTDFVSKHNNILTISWDFQKDKNTANMDPKSLPSAGSRRSRANSLPSKVIIDKNKLSPSLHHKITLELSTGSNPDILYDVPRRTCLSSEHIRRFKSANNESAWNQPDERSSKCVVYENVIIRTGW